MLRQLTRKNITYGIAALMLSGAAFSPKAYADSISLNCKGISFLNTSEEGTITGIKTSENIEIMDITMKDGRVNVKLMPISVQLLSNFRTNTIINSELKDLTVVPKEDT